MATKITSLSPIACLFLVGALLQVVSAVDYDVGGNFGWNLPANSTFFSDWTRNKTFFIGDKLVFRSKAEETHDVAEPERQVDFEGCVKPGIVLSTSTVLSITLDAPPRRRYFICTVGSHCNAGMKFAIDVFVRPGTPDSALLPPPPPSSASSLRFGAVLAAALAGLLLLLTI
ncbi:umecyanin-like [Benincasa hispida]|uniref:umecyanin-like n=1 Tax=Benincasa hispida TaxID=102211 RepID=UPI001900E486|nr:umecyanin-like [Benincasa hispida]